MSKAAMAVAAAVEEQVDSNLVDKVQKPVNPKTGKGGKTVTKGILKPVPTNGHKQVHMKQPEELAGVLKALRYALNDSGAIFTEQERAGAVRVMDRIEARTGEQQ